MSLTRDEAIHLSNRAGFGPRPAAVEPLMDAGLESFLEEQLAGRTGEPEVDLALEAYPGINKSIADIVREHQEKNLSRAPVERALMDLREAKLFRAARSPNQLREVMADFWFNHFNVYAYSWEPSLPAYEKTAIRPHVLGRFRDLIGAVAHDPSMMFFLDAYTNVADGEVEGKLVRGLNENYARELLELHTVGVDAGYSQSDVTDAARALTGWTIGGWGTPDPSYEFVFDPDLHDWSVKSVFGLHVEPSGEDEGEQLLDFLSSHPKTARFISRKLVTRFVADDPPGSLVDRCAARFLATDGSISETLYEIFTSPEFWSLSNRANKFKTPFEFVVSCLRMSEADPHDLESVVESLELMGMPLHEAKPPTGYATPGAAWMSPSSQVYRFDFALALAANRVRGVTVPGVLAARQRPLGRARGSMSSEATVAKILEWFESSALPNRLSLTTRQQVLEVVSSPAVDASQKALGLLLASPEFAMR